MTSPVGVGLYLEPTFGKLEDSLEIRLLLQSNFLDDRLIFAANLVYEPEKEKYDPAGGIIRNSMGDILYGASYRFAPSWSAGAEGRFHTDHDGYYWNKRTQIANFIGPTLHYAAQKWWGDGRVAPSAQRPLFCRRHGGLHAGLQQGLGQPRPRPVRLEDRLLVRLRSG